METYKPEEQTDTTEIDLEIEQKKELFRKKDLFKKDAERVLGNQYDGAEINDVIDCFRDEDMTEWFDRMTELSEKIDDNKISHKLSSEEMVIMKAKFVGEMRMYSTLNGDRRDAELWRNCVKEAEESLKKQ